MEDLNKELSLLHENEVFKRFHAWLRESRDTSCKVIMHGDIARPSVDSLGLLATREQIIGEARAYDLAAEWITRFAEDLKRND